MGDFDGRYTVGHGLCFLGLGGRWDPGASSTYEFSQSGEAGVWKAKVRTGPRVMDVTVRDVDLVRDNAMSTLDKVSA